MSKFVYCTNCGAKIKRYRKAVKSHGVILDMIDPHVCTDEPMPIDLTPCEVIGYEEPEGKFVEKLNDLGPRGTLGSVSTANLEDRRPAAQVKTTAPDAVLSQIKNMTPSTPEKELEDE